MPNNTFFGVFRIGDFMPAYYYKCNACLQMFVTGEDLDPDILTCALTQCDINQVSEEEANRTVEELRDEQ